ncbi:MAG: trimethylamine methyltransferase family protein, partial [Actinomycetota bacterium]
MSGAPARRRGGGRAARREMRSTSSNSAAAFLTRKIAPFEIVSEEGLELLEHNAEMILETVGVEIRDHPGAVERFRDAGADVDGTRVRFPRGMCRQLVQATTPTEYTQHARNSDRNVKIGGDATVFAPNYGSPFAFDL